MQANRYSLTRWIQRLSTRNKVAASGCAILLLLLIFRGFFSETAASSWVRPELRDLAHSMNEWGILQPVVLTQLTSRASGNLVQVPADGTRVPRGEALFLIDENELTEKIQQLEEDIANAAADLDVAKQEFLATKEKSLATLARDQARLTYAEFEQAYKQVALQPADRRTLDINIEIAELDLMDAEAEYERMQKMIRQSFAAASQLEPLERRVDSARTFLKELKLDLEIRKKGISPEERIALQAEVDQARSRVERSQLELEAKLNTLRTAMDQQRANRRHLEQNLALLEEELNHTVIRAPIDGVVRLRRKLRWSTGGWQPISTGTMTENQDILADLVSPDQMQIEIMVHESDVGMLKTGMPVQVELTAYPEETFAGTLVQVSSLGQDRSDLAPPGFEVSPAEQAVFRGMVEFDARNTKIQPGMSAQIQIILSPATPRRVLPRAAVGYINRIPHVYPWRGNAPLPIQGEMIDSTWFEVTGGLDTETKVRIPFPPPSGGDS